MLFRQLRSQRALLLADLRVYVSDVLRDLNYRVLSAGRARAALTIRLAEQQVDLLLIVVVIPGIMAAS